MTKHKDEKILFHLKDLAGDFLSKNSNRTSLITVTNVVLSSDLKRANILLSVLPKKKRAHRTPVRQPPASRVQGIREGAFTDARPSPSYLRARLG